MEILPQRHHHYKNSIYADIYVQTESLGKVKARCLGWYPKVDVEVILKEKWLNDSCLCLFWKKYSKERLFESIPGRAIRKEYRGLRKIKKK